MIEQDVYQYLKNATISGLSNSSIYLIQAPTETNPPMPWLIVENTSGTREKITSSLMEEISEVRITVDCGPAQVFAGRTIIQRAKALLENYRGDMYTAHDVHIECGAIRGWAGIGGAYRYQVDCSVRFTESYSQP